MPEEYQDKKSWGSRQVDLDKRAVIANHDWRYNSQEKRLKYESLMAGSVGTDRESYPYLGGDKDAELEATKLFLRSVASSSRPPTQSKPGGWTQEKNSMPQEASFLAGRGRGLEDNSRSSRMTLPIIVNRLQKRVDEDWEGSTVVVSATDQDLVQIAFHMHTVDSERGVKAYMGVLSKDVELVGASGLRKVSQLWGMTRDFRDEFPNREGATDPTEHTWMFFLLMPKWVRMRPTDAYYTVHPRSQGSAFRMSTAGSSVLLSLGQSVLEHSQDAGSRRKDENCPSSGSQTARAKVHDTIPEKQKLDLSLIEEAVSTLPLKKQSSNLPPVGTY